MKVLLEIEDNKALYLMEILKNLSFVKTKVLLSAKSDLINDINEAVDELRLIREGKLEGIPANELIDEL